MSSKRVLPVVLTFASRTDIAIASCSCVWEKAAGIHPINSAQQADPIDGGVIDISRKDEIVIIVYTATNKGAERYSKMKNRIK